MRLVAVTQSELDNETAEGEADVNHSPLWQLRGLAHVVDEGGAEFIFLVSQHRLPVVALEANAMLRLRREDTVIVFLVECPRFRPPALA
ncbi:hypothetical protein N2W54_003596 [Lotmaria passim]